MTCSVDGCDRLHYGRSFCKPHYQRWHRHGDPLGGRKSNDAPRAANGIPAAWLADHLSSTPDPGSCIPWPFGANPKGYGQIRIGDKKQSVHRLVANYWHGTPPEGFEAAHCRPDGSACESKRCVNPHHLRWASRLSNEADKALHGVRPIGEGHGRSKLTVDQVVEIRSLISGGRTRREVALAFGVSVGAISNIINGRTWSHA